MYVVKRNGKRQAVHFDKITERLSELTYGLDSTVCPAQITKRVIAGMVDGMHTHELDSLASEEAASLSTVHPDYSILASRLAISNLHKETVKSFSETVKSLYEYERLGRHLPKVSKEFYNLSQEFAEQLDAMIVHKKDRYFSFFGFKTLEKSYLLRIDGKIVERPQFMFLRVALALHKENLDLVRQTYEMLSDKYFIHATPTLFNAGTNFQQLSSCFLHAVKSDSIDGIFDTVKNCAMISKYAGGIGMSVNSIRGKDSYIAGTNGKSNGLVPMLKVFNSTARYVDQGGNKRPGAFAIYLEPWHSDIEDVLRAKRNQGTEETTTRDLFYGLWVPDLFMKRVAESGTWSLFSPNDVPGLDDTYGEEFEALYAKYEQEKKYVRQIPAIDLWYQIIDAQIETGTPYMLYKDHVNRKSNQKNIGVIKSSNLCTEIVEYSGGDEVAVCNLASIGLAKFVKGQGQRPGQGQANLNDLRATEPKDVFDFEKLSEIVQVVTRNLNKIIDLNYYPIPETRNSNFRNRPIGIGVQGLADLFLKLKLPFTSPLAKRLNIEIFECIYYNALKASCDIAKETEPYPKFQGSPASQGILQFDLWSRAGHFPNDRDTPFSGRYDFDSLKKEIVEHGLANSLLVAPMPTASTSQILGNNEGTEAITSNLYTRTTGSGTFQVINKYLLQDLLDLGLWNTEMKKKIMYHDGSVQDIKEIPDWIKKVYKTVWEISQRDILDMTRDRAIFVDQSQSTNVFIAKPDYKKMTSMHFYGWKLGLKTGMYYLRLKPTTGAIKFTVDLEAPKEPLSKKEDPEECLSCGA